MILPSYFSPGQDGLVPMDVRNGSIPVPTSAERFLGVLSRASSAGNLNNSSTETSSAVGAEERDDSELDEDDVFWTGDFAAESNQRNHSTLPSSISSNHRPHVLHQHPGFSQPEAFGILAALPENETGPSSLRSGSHFYHKTSVSSSSSSSSSSSRMIPSFPKPPLDRSLKYQSAPVNVPMMSKGVLKNLEFDEIDDNDEEGDVKLLPPHEIVARSLAHSPALACSVLEGAGRTLKGRDLRRVRNAVFRRTVIDEGNLILKYDGDFMTSFAPCAFETCYAGSSFPLSEIWNRLRLLTSSNDR